MWTNRLSGVGALVLLLAPALFGTTYTYTKITDDAPGSTLGAFTSFLGPFLINSSGAVAFTASSGAVGEVGIYTGSASGINTVYVGGLTFSSPIVFGATGFNDSGTVVYLTEARAVYTATAGGTPFMVSAPTRSASGIFPGDQQCWNGRLRSRRVDTSILTRTGTGDAQTLVSDTELPRSNALAAPTLIGLSINNSGTVAFYASEVQTCERSCSCGIFTKGPSGTSGSGIAVSAKTFSSVYPQINDNGAIAFAGTYQSVKGVFVASNGQVAAR